MNNGSNLIIGLDVGTTKICTVVAEIDRETKSVRVIGLGHAASSGLRKGVVVDMESAVGAITKSIENAEKMANVEIHSVFAGITGGHIKSLNSRGVAAIGDGGEITARDVERAINAARAVSMPADREILHTIPQEFTVDGQAGVKDPEGMSGVRLEAEAHIVTGAISSAQNIIKSINRAGIEVEDIVLESLASSIAVLSDDEKNSGVLLVDTGGGTSDVMVFHRGSIRQSEVLALGGDHVTNDISVALRIPISLAEEIKVQHGSAMEERVDPGEEIELPASGNRPAIRYSRRELARVIQYRMTEILTLVRKMVDRGGLRKLLGSGVVLTGGGCLMDGAAELAEKIFGLPVRVGLPRGISGIAEVLDSPIYATGAGLTQYGLHSRREGRVSRFKKRGRLARLCDRVREWFGSKL
ncbi:MAG: cell division protein FtsA [Candidatus Aureabacteria bacterium]|nr:cell division protein FtsA [Candidatus Auribacterota bacterium]